MRQTGAYLVIHLLLTCIFYTVQDFITRFIVLILTFIDSFLLYYEIKKSYSLNFLYNMSTRLVKYYSSIVIVLGINDLFEMKLFPGVAIYMVIFYILDVLRAIFYEIKKLQFVKNITNENLLIFDRLMKSIHESTAPPPSSESNANSNTVKPKYIILVDPDTALTEFMNSPLYYPDEEKIYSSLVYKQNKIIIVDDNQFGRIEDLEAQQNIKSQILQSNYIANERELNISEDASDHGKPENYSHFRKYDILPTEQQGDYFSNNLFESNSNKTITEKNDEDLQNNKNDDEKEIERIREKERIKKETIYARKYKGIDKEFLDDFDKSYGLNNFTAEIKEEPTKEHLGGPITKDSVTERYDQELAEIVFPMLVSFSLGPLYYENFVFCLKNIIKERNHMHISIQKCIEVLNLMNRVMFSAEIVALVFIIFKVFGTGSVIFSIYIGLVAFILFPSTKEILEAFFFILIKHPYDVGDRINVDGHNVLVKQINLFSTILEKWSGEYLVMNNRVLNSIRLYNVRRSGYMAMEYKFIVNKEFMDKILKIELKLQAFVIENHEFTSVQFSIGGIENSTHIYLFVIVRQKRNFQIGFYQWRAHTKFSKELKKLLKANKVTFHPCDRQEEVLFYKS